MHPIYLQNVLSKLLLMLFLTENRNFKVSLLCMNAGTTLILCPLCSTFFFKKKTKPQKKSPTQNKNKTQKTPLVNLILQSFFVQVLMQIIFCIKYNNVIVPLKLVSSQVLWKFKYLGDTLA